MPTNPDRCKLTRRNQCELARKLRAVARLEAGPDLANLPLAAQLDQVEGVQEHFAIVARPRAHITGR